MGYDLTAYVFYGFPLYETDSEHDDYSEELEEVLENWWYDEIAAAGIVAPKDSDYKSQEWQDHIKRYGEFAKTKSIEEVRLGMFEFTYTAIAIPGTVMSAGDGSVLNIKLPPVGFDWNRRLEEWCTKYGFKYRNPEWYLGGTYW